MTDRISQLERLQRLREQGAIDDAEFAIEKSLLSTTEPAHAPISKWVAATFILTSAIALSVLAWFWLSNGNNPSAFKAVVSAQTISTHPPASSPPPMSTKAKSGDVLKTSPSWGCDGWHNNVQFSNESGDGSGVELNIQNGKVLTFKSWEGGAFSGIVQNTSNNSQIIGINVTFKDFPDQIEKVILGCKDGKLMMASKNFGTAILHIGKANPQ